MTASSKALPKDAHTTYVFGAWLVLMVLTAASWWVGADHAGSIGIGRTVAMIGILVLTFMKIFVVGHSFMELREAAPWLMRAFTAWCIVLCAVLSGLFLRIS